MSSRTTKPPPSAVPAQLGRSLWAHAWRKLSRDRVTVVCLAVIAAFALAAIVSPYLFAHFDEATNYDSRHLAPSRTWLFGTDALGRSVLQKVFLGAHVSLTVALFANLIAVPLGMLLGAIAGYFGRRVDEFIVWFYTTLDSIPGIILLVAIKFAFQGKVLFEGTPLELDLTGMPGIILALGITSWVGTCRIVRAETMKLKELDYVTAARATGRGSLAILLRHIMPNVAHIGIISMSLGFVGAIGAEVTLSYLNLGVHELPSWGKMINEARMDLIVGRWWEMVAAVGATFIIVLAWNIFGDRLRDALDPRLKNV